MDEICHVSLESDRILRAFVSNPTQYILLGSWTLRTRY